MKSRELEPYWTNARASRDTVVGTDVKSYTSDQATIWRWRQAFQHDFAARMDWTIKEVAQANHNPAVVVNGVDGKAPLMVNATVGVPVTLDASKSSDRDRNTLQYSWFFYPEAGSGLPNAGGGRSGGGSGAAGAAAAPAGRGSNAAPAPAIPSARRGGRPAPTPRVTIANGNAAVATVMPNTPGVAHVILAITDNGMPALTSYRQVILTIRAAAR